MFSSEAISKDMSGNSGFLISNPVNQSEFMGSDIFHNQNQRYGLSRYRSAPSSYLAALLDSTSTTADNSSSGDESEALFTALLMDGSSDHLNQKNSDNQTKYSVKMEAELRPGFPNGQMGGYENAVVGSYHPVEMESNGNNGHRNNCSNLVRQSSSPAGLFNGFGVMGEVGNYKLQNHAEANSSDDRLSNRLMNFSSGPSSSSRFMPSIPENANKNFLTQTPENELLRKGSSNANGREYEATFHRDSWKESPFNSLKRNHDGDMKIFSNFNVLEDDQNGDARKRSCGLVSHLSLPKTSSELAAVENYLQVRQEMTAPCQIRAKRGCATHPRSIAERVRRTRISEKMKKLQDLFPNMDKQTNTADMLELAVEYIKDLEKQVQKLSDTKAKCVCSSKPQETST